MATQLLFMATDQNPSRENSIGGEETFKPESSSKQRGRKPGKNQSQKKPPQRGMGVAKLESLRLQDRWKKLTETNQIQSQFVPITDPLNGIPLQYSKLGNINYAPMIGSSSGGFGFDQVVMNPYGIGTMDQRVFENSKELSSMPKLQCVSDHCNNCFKKKRMNGDGNKFMEMSQINGCDFLGLNRQYTSRDGYFSTRNCHEAVEVLAIHKRGNSTKGSVLEYEFFPGKNGRSDYENNGESEEAGVGSCYGGNSDSNCIDLSLKLSF